MNEELLNEFMTILKEKNIDVENLLDMPSQEKNETKSEDEKKNQNSENKEKNYTGSNSSNPFENLDINTLLKLKSILDKYKNSTSNDANLLIALKPYMKKSRQCKIDKYAQMLKMAEIIKNLRLFGGD